jgi:hypothetical protein
MKYQLLKGIKLARHDPRKDICEYSYAPPRFIKGGNFLNEPSDYRFLKKFFSP